MARYRITVWVMAVPATTSGACGRTEERVVEAPCAQLGACEIARPYVDAGLVVEWRATKSGLRRLGRRWSGRFIPGDGDDGLSGDRVPRRPRPPAGTLRAQAEPPTV
jgi:hypothetical protein